MDRDFFSQPINNRFGKSKAVYYSQPPGQCDESIMTQNPETSKTNNASINNASNQLMGPPATQVEKPENNISELCNTFKTLSDELSTSLNEYKTERSSLENELNRLNQENDFIKLELDRQKKHIDELNETSRSHFEKLTKDETETKRIIELKVLEMQDLFEKIRANDKYIADFKRSFSQSIEEVESFSKNIKDELKSLVGTSLKADKDYLSHFDDLTSTYVKDMTNLNTKATNLDKSIEIGIDAVKEKQMNEVKFLQEMNTVLQEIEVAQKRKKDLEDSLHCLKDNILKMNSDHETEQEQWGNELNELRNINSQLTLRKAALDQDISLSENDLVNMETRYDEMIAERESLQAILVKKRLEDEKIQQEIESLEEQANRLQNDHDTVTTELKLKEHVELELKEFENEMLELVEKCKDLEEERIKLMNEMPLDKIKAEEEYTENLKTLNQEFLEKVDRAKKQLEHKHSELDSVQQDIQLLRQID